ncbi:MAG: transglycosylase SLT domain-containing protein [Burkholderiaceae bacterium]|nr:transglycosylase SLT domain-containing protein [Burkholderiaceae bacterium]
MLSRFARPLLLAVRRCLIAALCGPLLVGCALGPTAPNVIALRDLGSESADPVLLAQKRPVTFDAAQEQTTAFATPYDFASIDSLLIPELVPDPDSVFEPADLWEQPLRGLATPDDPTLIDPSPIAESAPEQDSEFEPGDLWARLRRGFAMPGLDNRLVREHERWYARRPEYVARMTERAGRYLFHIVEEIERRAMPTELALLPFIESAFNPKAVSRSKASGMWQFMAATGREFSLKQNVFRDDRRDVLASTSAALDYLSRLHSQFGDWRLALAAYNWGEGNVQRAIKRCRRAGKPATYGNLKLPRETRHYVPKLQAIKNLVSDPERFGLSLPELADHPYFLSVPIDRDIDVDLAARFSDVSIEEFKALNPQMNKPVILAAGTPQVLLPYDNANQFAHRMAMHRGVFASWTAWVAPKTMRLSDVAKRVGMSVTALRKVNRIPRNMRVRAGSTLLVPRSVDRKADVSERIAENGKMVLTPERRRLRRLVIKARKGDSVAKVARRHGVSASRVAKWNKVRTKTTFTAGQKVVIYTRAKPKRVAATRTKSKHVARSKRTKSNSSGVRLAMDR